MSLLRNILRARLLGLPQSPPPTAAFVPTASTRRTFLTPPFSTAPPRQTLTASRTLPYPSSVIYSIIADVDSYSLFLPFCKRSTVTKWSEPDGVQGMRWPSEAELVIGWKGVTEAFKSRIYCVPGNVVEAVGGGTVTRLPKHQIVHHEQQDSHDHAESASLGHSEVLSHLLTRWTVGPREGVPAGHTDVHLAIEFQFSNPLYSAMSGAVADKVAGYMIEAFEGRVVTLLKDMPGDSTVSSADNQR